MFLWGFPRNSPTRNAARRRANSRLRRVAGRGPPARSRSSEITRSSAGRAPAGSKASEHPAPEGGPEMGFAIRAWLVLLYLFSSKPGWFACLLVILVIGVLIAGC